MSITINGATNTLTAASGLTIAGNTAVTGALSATGAISGQSFSASGGSVSSKTYVAYSATGGGKYALNSASYGFAFVQPTDSPIMSLRRDDGLTSTIVSYSLAATTYASTLAVSDTTDATSTTAASLKTAGGLAVAKKAYFGDAITATAVTPLALRRDLQISAVDQSFGLTSYSARYDASNYGIGAYISAVSGSAWSVSNYESYLAFQVTPSASTTPAEALRLSSTALTLATGVQLNLGATGQIKFPATQNASSDANTLDDYEEGTWTPTIGSGGGTITTSSATGSYVKIGRMVHATVNITITNAGTGTGALTFTVPFTSNTAGNSTAGSGVETAAVGFTGTCYLGTNSVTVSAYKDGFTTPIGTGNGLIYSIVYQTA